MLVNVQTYVASQSAKPTDQIDPVAFSAALAGQQQTGKITDPVPTIQFTYDPTSQVQTLSRTGVLTDKLRGQLSTLPPASTLLAALLQDVRDQAVQQFQALAVDLLTASPADLDTYSLLLIGLDGPKQQKQLKAELVRAFLPLVAQKLSRQLIVQNLSSSLSSDPTLTEALLTDAALLSDPTNVGTSLLGAFLAVGQQGVSASYFASSDGSGTAQAIDRQRPFRRVFAGSDRRAVSVLRGTR